MRIAALREAYAAATARPAAVVAQIYERIAAARDVPAWISLVDREEAIARAGSVDPALPLSGIPFAVKDNIDVAGMQTTAGCPGFAYTAAETATVVGRLVDAGAVLIGKTNLDQFATGLVGTRSPYGALRSVLDPRYVAGGSSSGSAVVVATGAVAFALGTDTAGSGRVPAAFNGIVGLKPTRGLLSTRGVVAACRSLDCVSVFARDVDGARRVLAEAVAFDARDPWSRASRPASGPSRAAAIGVPARVDGLDARFVGHWERAVAHATTLASVVEIDLAPFEEAAALLYDGPWLAERWASVGAAVEAGLAGLDPTVAEVIARGRDLRAEDVFRAQDRLMALRREVREIFARVDALALPTTPTIPTPAEVAAEPVAVNRRLGRWTNGVNLLDLAALALPAGDDPPFGVSLVAPAFAEPLLLDLGSRWAGEEPASEAPATGAVGLAVVGAHLSGEPLNHQLTSRGARLVATTRTAPAYRLVALPGGPPERPGLVRAPRVAGAGIEVEVWAMPRGEVGGFMLGVPAPLCIGTVELADGSSILGFLCESHAAHDAEDITHHGSWRAYLASRNGAPAVGIDAR